MFTCICFYVYTLNAPLIEKKAKQRLKECSVENAAVKKQEARATEAKTGNKEEAKNTRSLG